MAEACGGVVDKVGCRTTQASRAFGSPRNSVFAAADLTLKTKRMVYRSVVLAALLYGAENWGPTQKLVGKLDWFHQCCAHYILVKV